ncbi:hypothetical protein YTPLAS18_24440 [Nitrospira sp.]|nr:hypothetical protein YTPLAS18_24440 [Nitrospira sp.]
MIARVAGYVLRGSALVCAMVGGGLWLSNGWDPKYVLVLMVAVLLAGGSLLNSSRQVNIALSWMAIMLTCYTVNFFLAFADASTESEPPTRWVSFQSGEERTDRAEAARRLGVPFDTRSRLDVLSDLRADGLDAWPTVSPRVLIREWWTHFHGANFPTQDRPSMLTLNGHEVLPIGGIANKPTVYCNENGTYPIYQSDEHGFANPPGLWGQVPLQIAVVGDSFVHGACVETGQSYVDILRDRFPGTLNLGNDGIGPLFQYAAITEYLPSRKPRLILWSYFEGNDLYDLLKERHTLMRRYLEDDFTQELEAKQEGIDLALMAHVESAERARSSAGKLVAFGDQLVHPFKHIDKWKRTLKLSYVAEVIESSLMPRPNAVALASEKPFQPSVNDADLALFRRILEKALRRVEGWGGKMIFVYLPRHARYVPGVGGQPDRARVMETVRSLNIPIVDLHPVFLAQPDPLDLFPFRLPTHYNPTGNRVVAEAILLYLDRSGLARDIAVAEAGG